MDLPNYIKFRLRLQSSIPSDVHREFSGTYQPRWRTLSVSEIREVGRDRSVKLVPIFAEDKYTKEDGELFSVPDFQVGSTITIGPTFSQRDNGAVKTFVITEVDTSSLTVTNSGSSRDVMSDTAKENIFGHFRAKINERTNPKQFIREVGKRFKSCDESGDRRLDKEELRGGLGQDGICLTDGELDQLMRALDVDGDGRASYDEFMRVVRGPMSEARKCVVVQAFKKLDYNKTGSIQIDHVRSFYQTSYLPKVQTGVFNEDFMLEAFMRKFDNRERDNVILYREFEDYYNALSSKVDSDEEFVERVTRVWNLDHRNVATKRVPAFH